MSFHEITSKFHIPSELCLLYELYPEDVMIAAEDAARFAADLVDEMGVTGEPWPAMIVRNET